MHTPLTVAPSAGHSTLLYAPYQPDLDAFDAHIAFVGMPFGNAYTPDAVSNDQTRAPDAVRAATDRVSRGLERYDFDVGGPIYDGRPVKAVDIGNVAFDIHDHHAHFAKAEAVIRRVLSAGAMPITIGGDHGIPIPILRALEDAPGGGRSRLSKSMRISTGAIM